MKEKGRVEAEVEKHLSTKAIHYKICVMCSRKHVCISFHKPLDIKDEDVA